MRRILPGLALTSALLAGGASLAIAQCQIPLVVGGVGTTANCLVILDSSGSMNEIVFHDAYNPATNYTGNFSRTTEYDVTSDGARTPRSFNSNWPNTPSAYLVNSDQGMAGKYSGNYLNWVYFHATAAQRAAIPTYTKIQAAKSVVNSVLGSVTTCRFAIEKFNADNGGVIVSPFGTDVATMQTQVNAIRADAFTPLAESMVTALNYFSQTGAGAPIQASCQKSFIVLVTDGIPTRDANVPDYLKANDCGRNDPGTCLTLAPGSGYSELLECRAYVDNVACYMYENDLRPDLVDKQNVETTVIGFAINHPLLQTTASVGGGEYYTASNLAGLQAALAQTFNTISKRVAAGAAVAVVGAEDRLNNRLFRARYETSSWRGFLEAFEFPFKPGQSPVWEAGSLLAARSPDTRVIYTSNAGGSTVSFSASNAPSLMTALGAADLTEATNIINYVRGQAVSGTRDREGWILGDIVDGAPLAVGRPMGYSKLPGYGAFRSANAGRKEVLYVGANDGMLHCFDSADGQELWAYVPRTQLPRVRNLMSPSYCHDYFLNATPTVFDLQVNGQWKTVLVSGQEPGRNGMFALDVTDPAPGKVSVLWDVEVSGLKGSTNTPTLVYDRVRRAPVLCVGTGYSPAASGDTLIVINPSNGNVLDRIGLSPSVADNKTTRATVLDLDFDGYDDLLYIGDLSGRLWRVDLRTNPWTKSLLFQCGQPIQAPPAVTMNAKAQPMLFFGTGRFVNASDLTSTSAQTIYGVVDDGSGATLAPSDLVNQTLSINPPNARGWYVHLVQASGERVTRSPALINGTVYVTSFGPNSNVCSTGGQAWLYTLDYKDGSAPDHANGAANNVTAGRTKAMGEGQLSDPTVDLHNEVILMQSSNAGVLTQSIPGGLKKLLVRGWRQRWN